MTQHCCDDAHSRIHSSVRHPITVHVRPRSADVLGVDEDAALEAA